MLRNQLQVLEVSVFAGDLISQLNIKPFLKDPKPKQAFKHPALSLVK